jgi:hypothetical protein
MEVVTSVEVLPPYALRVEFSDRVCREVDLENELYGEVFEPLNKGSDAALTPPRPTATIASSS